MQRPKTTHFFCHINNIVHNRLIWFISLYGMLMFTPFLILSNLWGPVFIAQSYELSREAATNLFQSVFIGFIIGAPFFGWLSDKIQSRKKPLYLATSATFLAFAFMIFFYQLNILYITVIMALFGFFTSGFLPAFSVIKEVTPPSIHSAALGFMNTLNMLGGPIFMTITGFLLDYFWQGAMSGGNRVYDQYAFTMSFSILLLLYIMAFGLLQRIPETHCQSIQKDFEDAANT